MKSPHDSALATAGEAPPEDDAVVEGPPRFKRSMPGTGLVAVCEGDDVGVTFGGGAILPTLPGGGGRIPPIPLGLWDLGLEVASLPSFF